MKMLEVHSSQGWDISWLATLCEVEVWFFCRMGGCRNDNGREHRGILYTSLRWINFQLVYYLFLHFISTLISIVGCLKHWFCTGMGYSYLNSQPHKSSTDRNSDKKVLFQPWILAFLEMLARQSKHGSVAIGAIAKQKQERRQKWQLLKCGLI